MKTIAIILGIILVLALIVLWVGGMCHHATDDNHNLIEPDDLKD